MAKSSLKTLIRLARYSVDEHRKALGMLLAQEEAALADIHNHHRALEHERRVVSADSTGTGRHFGAYFDAWTVKLDQLQQRQRELAKAVEEARERLADAYRERKSREMVQQAREDRAAIEAGRVERSELDEIGQNQHRMRRDADSGQD